MIARDVRSLRAEAARVVRERFARGESADEIAARYGVKRRVVYLWASGRGMPSRVVAGRIVAGRKTRAAS